MLTTIIAVKKSTKQIFIKKEKIIRFSLCSRYIVTLGGY